MPRKPPPPVVTAKRVRGPNRAPHQLTRREAARIETQRRRAVLAAACAKEGITVGTRGPIPGMPAGAVGRPPEAKTKIDRTLFESALRCQCSQVGIARQFGVDAQTLADWCVETYGATFADLAVWFGELGHNSIRVAHYNRAVMGDMRAIEWWGKQYMGQSDKVDNTVRPGIPEEDRTQMWSSPDGKRTLIFQP